MAAEAEHLLKRRWVHAHEEDGEGTMVFRPAGTPLPPSRGRMWFELRGDGSFIEGAPGPVDVPERHRGRWSLDGDRIELRAEGDRPDQVWRVVSADGDRLVLAR